MALDTVKLLSPIVGPQQADRIEQSCMRKLSVSIASGRFQYDITTGSVEGSWDDTVNVRVDRQAVPRRNKKGEIVGSEQGAKIVVEGSVHKALMGHNVYGGPTDPVAACRWLLSDLAGRLWVDLPNADLWTVAKVDIAEVYLLPSFAAVQEYVEGLNQAEFPRRPNLVRYSSESIMSPGTTTTVKVYHKGPEFYAHDRKRLRGVLDAGELEELQDRAHRSLRVEVSIKAKKLAADNKGDKPAVVQLTRDYLEGVHDRETARLLREASTDMETVRTHNEVSKRLQEMYSCELASRLFGTWLQLAALGEKTVKASMKDRTFYWQRQKLQAAGCSWHGADVLIRPQHSAIPAGFAPIRTNPLRVTAEDPFVVQQLLPFRMAA